MAGLLHRCKEDGKLVFPTQADLARHQGHKLVLAGEGSLTEWVRWNLFKTLEGTWLTRLLS